MCEQLIQNINNNHSVTLNVKKSAVIIITYKRVPDLNLINFSLNHVDYVFISDNASDKEVIDNLKLIKSRNSERIFLKLNKENFGLSKPLNEAVEYLAKIGVYWFYIFDQDAIVDDRYFSEAINVWDMCEKKGMKVGMIVPIVGNQINLLGHNLRGKYYISRIRSAITSGIFTNIDIFKSIGGFDETFFVYGVDIDFTIRIYKAGYLICRINIIFIVQSYGQSVIDNRIRTKIFFKLNSINSLLNIKLNLINSYQTVSYKYSNESLNSQLNTSRIINRRYRRIMAELYRLVQKYISPLLRGEI